MAATEMTEHVFPNLGVRTSALFCRKENKANIAQHRHMLLSIGGKVSDRSLSSWL